MTIRILSWNIWFGSYLDKITKFLKMFDADIIGLQEVTQAPDGRNNLAEKLAKNLKYSWVYAIGRDLRPWKKNLVMGPAILSKYPIPSPTVHILSKTAGGVAIQADVPIHDTMLHIIDTHFIHVHQKPSAVQEEQAHTLNAVAPKDHTIIMGDFNAIPESKTVSIMEKAFRRADGKDSTPTWSYYKRPEECCKDIYTVRVRLDYMFVTPDIQVRKFSVEQSDGSDHLPISMEIDI